MPLYNCKLRESFFILNSNAKITFPPSYFVPQFYPAVMMVEEVHMPLTH